jgi:hypothetical protein
VDGFDTARVRGPVVMRIRRRAGGAGQPCRSALDGERDAHAAADAQRGEALLGAARFISCSSVTNTRAPEAPIGWPMAMAPPLTLTMSRCPSRDPC